MATRTWTEELLDQLTWHWENQLRPRLDGLTDEEYLWEPVAGCWTIRPGDTPSAPGSIDWAWPPPEPAPVTTIAWRLAHVVVGVLGDRSARYFGGPAIAYDSYAFPGRAADSLRDLDAAYAAWTDGVRALDDEALARRCEEQGHEEDSMAALVLHIHRETIHHGAEIALLRDLFAHRAT